MDAIGIHPLNQATHVSKIDTYNRKIHRWVAFSSSNKQRKVASVKRANKKPQKTNTIEPLQHPKADNDPVFPPTPPAGFILDNDTGEVLLVAPSDRRVVKLREPETGRDLECLVRRAFLNSSGLNCLLTMPLDTPLTIVKFDGEKQRLREVSNEELEEVIPDAEYALAKKRLFFVYSGYCLTARGCFCFTEDDVMDIDTNDGTGSIEGVAVTTFQVGDDEFVIYTPLEPMLFVAYKDEATGELIIANEELMDDPLVEDAMEEEREFQQFVEEEGGMQLPTYS